MSDSILCKSRLSARHGWRRRSAPRKPICWRIRLMKKFLLATVALVALGATVPALAADLAARPYTKAAPYVAQPIYNWTGFYIGGPPGGALSSKNKFYRLNTREKNNRPFLRGAPGCADSPFPPQSRAGSRAPCPWLS